MKPLLILAALAAAVLVLRRNRPPVPEMPDDSEVVGMPTMPGFTTVSYPGSNSITLGPTFWDEWFATHDRRN